jgi:hypothetical protein
MELSRYSRRGKVMEYVGEILAKDFADGQR